MNKILIGKTGRFGLFRNRQKMKRGHPIHRFKRKGKLAFTLPATVDYLGNFSFPMDGNDNYGDCMYAAGLHGDNVFTANNGNESTFALQTIINDYLKLSVGDNGLDEGTLIQGWKQGLASVPAANILDAIDIDPTNTQMAQEAIYLFGAVIFMLDVPDKWIYESAPGYVWDVPATADRNNGHGILWGGYDSKQFGIISWGMKMGITPAGVTVCDPTAFVVFSLRWFNAQGYAPNGYHYTELAAEWVARGGNASALPSVSPFPAPTGTTTLPPVTGSTTQGPLTVAPVTTTYAPPVPSQTFPAYTGTAQGYDGRSVVNLTVNLKPVSPVAERMIPIKKVFDIVEDLRQAVEDWQTNGVSQIVLSDLMKLAVDVIR